MHSYYLCFIYLSIQFVESSCVQSMVLYTEVGTEFDSKLVRSIGYRNDITIHSYECLLTCWLKDYVNEG